LNRDRKVIMSNAGDTLLAVVVIGIELLYWIQAALVFYVYVGYPVLLWAWNRLRPERPVPARDGFAPSVSLIIPAFNEELVIAQKLENSLALRYPAAQLEILVVSDGSTDRTAEIVRDYADRGIRLLDLPENVGKAAAENKAVERIHGDILLFTDANVSLGRDAVRNLARHFSDPQVGCVIGQVTYNNEGETGVSEGEGFYWRYELYIRQQESRVGNLAAGSGPIMALRRELFRHLDPDISEDFVLPMQSAIEGYRVVYEPEAISSERLFQVSTRDMLKTRARTTTLDTRSLYLCRALLNPFRYPLYAWGLVSHKLLRWLVPVFMIGLLAANLLLLRWPFYRLSLALQVVAYLAAIAGSLWQEKGKPPRLLSIPFSFCLANAAVLVGVMRFATGKRSGRWKPVRQTIGTGASCPSSQVEEPSNIV
jgi:cellulose synthase/poly-beta-1,6-N-acetylglucosamine synthase-like glycosyltransferase